MLLNGTNVVLKNGHTLTHDYRNETFSYSVGPSQTKIYVKVLDHKTLGKDKTLGEGEVDVSLLAFLTTI